MSNSPRIFISHTSLDKKVFVERLATDLRDAGARVFYDEWSIRPAERLRDRISGAIRDCTHFLVVISKRSLKSNWVKIELDQALNLEIQGNGPKVLPVVFGSVSPDDMPLEFLGLRWVAFKTSKGKNYERALCELLKAVNLGAINHEVTLDEIKEKQSVFVKKHLAGTLDYQVFWSFWSKPVSNGNWFKLLFVIKDNILAEEFDEARTNVEILMGMMQYYGISTDNPPKSIADLLALPQVAENGQLLAWLLQLANLFRLLLDKEAILGFLTSKDAQAIHATCKYIEETGVTVDNEIIKALLEIVESSDDQRFYFSGVDSDGDPIAVDARRAAAISLMLASPSSFEMDAIIERVKKTYPKVVENMMGIRLRAAVNTSFGGSHRTEVPLDLANMGELLSHAKYKGESDES